jgi:hypothetical protein
LKSIPYKDTSEFKIKKELRAKKVAFWPLLLSLIIHFSEIAKKVIAPFMIPGEK